MNVLSQYLLTVGGQGKTVVVILDEAQQMSVEALEQIRILSTMETATRKLLQIVLVGQPELEEKLQRRDLRQLDQRIGIRCYLKPLSRKETFRYVEHRLRIAGLPGAVPFARERPRRGVPEEPRDPPRHQPRVRPRPHRGVRRPRQGDLAGAREGGDEESRG